jgi:hypothetical protein
MYDDGTATRSTVDGVFYIEDDLEVNSGNSGGPVYYDYGDGPHVIGVVSTGIAATSVGAHAYWLLDAMAANDYLLTEGANTPPNAGYDVLSRPWQSLIALNVLDNDRDADGNALSVTNVTQPTAGGTIRIGADGDLYLSPFDGFTGDVSFTYTVSDGAGGTDQASVAVTVTPGPTWPAGVTEIFRFFNAGTGGHFFTASEAERDTVVGNLPAYSYEFVSFGAYEPSSSGTDGLDAIYRFYNPSSAGHFFTASAAERDRVIETLPDYTYEGVSFLADADGSSGGEAVYRFFNTDNGGHFFTTSEAERDTVIETMDQYRYEGIGFWV